MMVPIPPVARGSRHFKEATYKTTICEKWRKNNGVCNYGVKCLFAHGSGELRNKFSTPPCLPVVKHPPMLSPPPPPPPPPSFARYPVMITPPYMPYRPQFILQMPPLPPLPPPPPVFHHTPLSEWSSLVKTVEELHKSLIEPKRNDTLIKEDLCVVCLDAKPGHVFMPCQHLSICDDCAPIFEKNDNKQCYICRGKALLVPEAMASVWNW